MILEQVITNRLVIDRPKQVRLFQVSLPRQTSELIGIETGLRWISGVPVPPVAERQPWKLPMLVKGSTPIGDLKLQSPEQGNIFYSGEIILNANNDYADFSSEYLVPANYNQLKAEEDPVRIGGHAAMLFGCYKDLLAETVSIPFRYVLTVYTWIRLHDNTQQS